MILSKKLFLFLKSTPYMLKRNAIFELWKEAVFLLYKNKGLKTNISTTGNPLRVKGRSGNGLGKYN
jgi:hypothetical protein